MSVKSIDERFDDSEEVLDAFDLPNAHRPNVISMKATIWHNPKCGTSRKTLAILEDMPGVEVEVIEYLHTPYARDKLAQLITDAGLTPRDAIRLMGTDAQERGLPELHESAILDAMVANPAYVNRPFVETEKGVRFCRPQDKVHEIL